MRLPPCGVNRHHPNRLLARVIYARRSQTRRFVTGDSWQGAGSGPQQGKLGRDNRVASREGPQAPWVSSSPIRSDQQCLGHLDDRSSLAGGLDGGVGGAHVAEGRR